MKTSFIPYQLFSILILCLVLQACGGGGSGGEFIGAAEVFVDAEPTTLDPGNEMRVFIDINHPNSKGILLKVRIPLALQYVTHTSLLDIDDQEDPIFIEPEANTKTADYRYLVYSIDHGSFEGADHARLKFDLEALSEAKDQLIEVDADVDNGKAFNAAKPVFEAQDSVSIEVID